MSVTYLPAKKRLAEPPLSLQKAREMMIAHNAGKEPDEVIDKLVSCGEAISQCVEQTREIIPKLLANAMQTEMKNTSQARNAAHRLFKNVANKLDAARTHADRAIAKLEASIMPPSPADAVSAIYAGELRSALLRMPLAERAKTIERAIGDNDDVFVSAALGGSLALTGIGVAERAALLDLWQRKRHGATLQRITKIKAVLAEHNRISSLLSGWSLSLFVADEAAIRSAQESERAAKEALADVG